ncbi:MAG: 4-hydroxy-3-methylbut-2-enyl diphosphate reductase [Fusobacteria bacterium]|nr:4-hydroxy-3-methylbut-2-enyl diphosphate reductase [Fusobacteriota bacterium]
MKIIRAEKMGFCFGVTKAVDMAHALTLTHPKKSIFILGMLVHNQHVINELLEKGIQFIQGKDIATLPEGCIVIIRAHGVTFELYQTLKAKKVELYDATCIFVKKARDLIIEKENDDFHILFIGDEDHPEVQGIVSHVKNVSLFPNLEVLKTTFNEIEYKKYFVMCQTTYNQSKFKEIKEYCNTFLKSTIVSDTICYATHERQEAIVSLAQKCDKIIIVGGKNSSNTVKLFQLAQEINPNSTHIETAEELDLTFFQENDIIGITAGASTPESSILEIEKKLMEAFVNNQDFESLLNEYSFSLERGQRIKGILIHKDNNFALLEIPGIKGQGRMDSKEVRDYKVGDEVEVKISTTTEDFYGNIAVSRIAIEKDNAYNQILLAHTNSTPLEAKVVEVIPGGYKLEHNQFNLFLPKSLASRTLMLNDNLHVVIKEIKSNSNIIVSYKDFLDIQISNEFNKLSIGETIEVTIKKISENGMIVNYNSLSGFIHISEISWETIHAIDTLFKEGQILNASIISLDKAKHGIKLSLKKLTPDPWIAFSQKYQVNSLVSGSVLELKPFGAILKLENGVRGFIHKSEVAWDRFIKNIERYLSVGDIVLAQIIEMDKEKKSVKLSLKSIKSNPWDSIEEKYPLDSITSGKITHIYDYGFFVEIEEGLEVFIYKNDIRWTEKSAISNQVGDVVSFKIIEVNHDKKQLKGSIKHLSANPYQVFALNHPIKSAVVAKILNISQNGLSIDLGNNLVGFIPGSEVLEKAASNLSVLYSVGQEIQAQIIELDIKKQRIILSIHKLVSAEERTDLDEMLKKYGV